jgi:hypothetical protein
MRPILSINHVPPPPQPFPVLDIGPLPAGTRLHRIHGEKYTGDQYVRDPSVIFRFSPIFHEGKLIPTWYAGASLRCALYETVFHQSAYLGAHRVISWPYLQSRRYSVCRTTRTLNLISFRAPTLSSIGITIDQLTATDPQYYVQTARWAEAAFAETSRVFHLDGLVWNSYRGNGDEVFVLFGDQRDTPYLEVEKDALSLTDDDECIALLNACLDETKIDISDHPDATPTVAVKRVPKKPRLKESEDDSHGRYDDKPN